MSQKMQESQVPAMSKSRLAIDIDSIHRPHLILPSHSLMLSTFASLRENRKNSGHHRRLLARLLCLAALHALDAHLEWAFAFDQPANVDLAVAGYGAHAHDARVVFLLA